MNKLPAIILILAAMTAALVSTAQEQNTRSLVGTVVSRDSGEPVGFALVSLQVLGHPEAVRQAMTDTDGSFRFEGLAAGSYRLDVRYTGYQPMREGLAIIEGEGEVRVTVALRTGARRDPALPDLVIESAGQTRLLGDQELAAFVAGKDEPVRPPAGPVSEKDFDRMAVGGSSVDGRAREGKVEPSMAETPAEGLDYSMPDLTDYVVRSVEESVRKQGLMRQVAGRTNGPVASEMQATVDDLLSSNADELWIIERPATPPQTGESDDPGTGCLIVILDDEEIAVPLEHTDVHIRIDGYVASVDVRQLFHNPFDETIEAEYLFPLPHDAAINDFLMVVGDRRIRGIIREKEEARQIYERARQAGHVASLLEQERPNIFRQRVANIEPGHKIQVEIHYFNALPYRDGEFELAFPLVVGPRFNPPGSSDPIGAVPRGVQPAGTAVPYLAPGERSGHDVNITVELDAGLPIDGVQSLNHAASIQRAGKSAARIQLARHDRIPNKDFVLRYRVAGEAVKSGVLVHRDGDDGYFSMMLVPPASLEGMRRAPVEFVFVLDCSGSMNGWPLQKSRAAMRRALRQLQPGDSFQIIRFSENASALGAVPVEATAANIERGIEYVDALRGGGGTMMIEGIKAALDFPHDPERMRIVTFMTDGYIGNEAEIFGEVARRLNGAKIFSFGVGQSVNRHLIEGLAQMGQGAVAYIGLDDDLDAVDEFYRIVRHPALTDIEIDWGAMQARQVFPQRLGDLFVGRPVLLHGRFEGQGKTTVTIRGRAGGREVKMKVEVDLDAGSERPALPLLWARSEIGHIAYRLAREPDESLQARGLDLALDYNLVSAWTSFVAVDASQVVDEPGTRTETVPVPVPEGVRHDTTVGGGRD
ncbi:hypothetical protein DRQ32_07550 [bacterium]|nr:MAG: hypothetical protein DRQ32_07550 [bacterium]